MLMQRLEPSIVAMPVLHGAIPSAHGGSSHHVQLSSGKACWRVTRWSDVIESLDDALTLEPDWLYLLIR